MQIERKRAAELGKQTLEIIEKGAYINDQGVWVHIAREIEYAIHHTESYPPDTSPPSYAFGGNETRFYVCNESTLSAAKRLVENGHEVMVLNFASAKNPGGGFLGGSRAQEESLARSSALYACIVGNDMYDYHRQLRNPIYSNYAIYSPSVPVFRDHEGTLLDSPYHCAFITSPAVNAGAFSQNKKWHKSRKKSRKYSVKDEMYDRIVKVLAIAAEHGHDGLVLGAWGCGVFRNNTEEIAELFYQALSQNFRGKFKTVVFAILDWSNKKRFIGPFLDQFGKDCVIV